MKESDHICPRCGGDVPNTPDKGQYSGAVSRTTREEGDTPAFVCSDCGTTEALEQFAGALTPQSEWVHPPVKVAQ